MLKYDFVDLLNITCLVGMLLQCSQVDTIASVILKMCHGTHSTGIQLQALTFISQIDSDTSVIMHQKIPLHFSTNCHNISERNMCIRIWDSCVHVTGVCIISIDNFFTDQKYKKRTKNRLYLSEKSKPCMPFRLLGHLNKHISILVTTYLSQHT